MKIKHLIIFLVALSFCSCNQKQKQEDEHTKEIVLNDSLEQQQQQIYELADLSNPILDEWVAYYKSGNKDFSLKNFKKVTDFIKNENEWTDFVSSSPLDTYNSDGSFYITLDYYNEFEGNMYIGSDIDSRVDLIDVRKNKALNIHFGGSSSWADDVFWVNDSVFVLLNADDEWGDNRNENFLHLYLSIWNIKGDVLANYEYSGDVKRPEYSYFVKRLIRSGCGIRNY